MHKNKITKKVFIFFQIFSILFYNIGFVRAASVVSFSDLGGVAGADLNGDGLNDTIDLVTPDTTTAEGNSTQNKLSSPELTINFIGNPSEGQQLTVIANVSGTFDSSKKSEFYYTWYLKRENGTDWDKNGKYDLNDWKIEAARINAQGDFDNADVKYTGTSNDDDGIKAEPRITGDDSWERTYDSDFENDSDAENCYMPDYVGGRIYELRKAEVDWSGDCPTGQHRVCVADRTAQCSEPDPMDNTKVLATLQDVKYCQEDSSESPKCEVKKGSDGKVDVESFTSVTECDNNETPVCISGTTDIAPSFKIFSQAETIEDSATAITNDGTICRTFFPLLGSGSSQSLCSENSLTSTLSTPSCTFIKGKNLCKHLFPKIPGDEQAGDGNFGMSEEEFWGTDPSNKSTNSLGIRDEAAVLGLGVDKFKWTYQDGDKVGVAVEGITAIPTKHNDSSMMRSWAFSKNKCDKLQDELSGNRAFYLEDIRTSQAGILTLDFDPNDCLEENLIDPTDTGQTTDDPISNDVTFQYSPEKPINDPSGDPTFSRGDILNIKALWTDMDSNQSDYYYTWTLEVKNGADTWKDITSSYLRKAINSEGYGLKSLDVPLSIPASEFGNNQNSIGQEIRFKVRIKKITDTETVNKSGQVVISVNNLSRDITARFAGVDAAGKLTKDYIVCNNSEEKVSCPVMENEILALELSDPNNIFENVSWTIDGEALSCTSAVSDSCTASNKTVFLPIVKPDGTDLIEVKVTARDKSNNSAEFSVSRIFKVIEMSQSSFTIVSGDESTLWPKIIGFFKDANENRFPDYSGEVFETYGGSDITLNTSFSPSWIAKRATINWVVSGSEEVSFSGNSIQFATEGEPGDSYNVTATVVYQQPAENRNALANFWGITNTQSLGMSTQKTIKLNVVKNWQNATLEDYRQFWGANLLAQIGKNVTFLAKLLLSNFVLLLVLGVVFSFLGRFQNKNA